LETLFKEFLNASRDHAAVVAAKAFILLRFGISVATIVFSPWDVHFLWVPLSEGCGAFIIDFHLLRHNSVFLVGGDEPPGEFEVTRNIKVAGVVHTNLDVAIVNADLL